MLQFAGLAALLVLLAGCRVSADKSVSKNGESKDVDIRTPLGSIHVHKGVQDAKATGLTLYPGARPMEDGDDSHHSANVDIASSLFGLKVVVAKFESDDPPEKILDFYRKDMAKLGRVIDCPSSGVNLKFRRFEKDVEVSCDFQNPAGDRNQLKVGTENNQRVVVVDPSGKGSQFKLIYVRAWDDTDTI
jgi:hypothetical protein